MVEKLDLLQYRTVQIANEITAELAGQVTRELLVLQKQSSKKPIKLLIHSPGGIVHGGFTIADTIKHLLTAPVHAIVVGMCCSAATFPLLVCKKRVALPHARFCLHSSTSDIKITCDDTIEEQVAAARQDALALRTEVEEFYCDSFKKTLTQVRKILKRGDRRYGNYLSAREARKLGLIHEIVSGKAGIFPAADAAA